MSSTMDRYRNLKEKGKLTPKAGAAGVTFSPSTEFSVTRPKLNHKPGQMQLASAYRDERVVLHTPEPPAESSCSLGFLERGKGVAGNEGSERDKRPNEATNNQQSRPSPTLTPTSLFDPTKQQRYEKFKSRVRLSSPSHKKMPVEQRDDHHSQSRRADNNSNLIAKDPSRHDTKEFVIYPPSTQKSNLQSAASTSISPSQRSAFKTPRSFATRTTSPTENSLDLPGPPSICSTSSHQMNQVGLPIASARHETPENTDHHNRSSDDPPTLPTLATASSQATPRRTPPLRSYASPSYRQASPEWSSKGEQPRNRGPPGFHAGVSRPKLGLGLGLGLAVNPKSTPTAKPPPLDYASAAPSFDRGMAIPTIYPPAGTSTKSTETSSETTSSTTRRDRVMEIRESSPLKQDTMSRPPLVEHSRPPIHDVQNRQSPARSLELRPSLELPSLQSNYSSDTGEMSTPHRAPANRLPSTNSSHGTTKGVSPLDFYRRIAAEKTIQASFAKQYAQPNSNHKTSPAPLRSLTPTGRSVTPPSSMFRRGDSPMSLPNYRLEAPRRTTSFPSLDQRTVRILYSIDFDQMIEEHIRNQTKDFLQQHSRGTPNCNPEEVALYARKRPLLEDEAANKEFDVINAETGQPTAMVVYVTSMMLDLQTKDITPVLQEFDSVFSEFSSAEDVYAKLAHPEVVRAQEGGVAAIIIFGHSDTGKSHTMLDFEERAAYDLFAMSRGTAPPCVSVQFLELTSSSVVDLLGSPPASAYISDEAGRFRVEGSTVKRAGSPRELLRILSDGRRQLMRSSGNLADHGYILCQLTVNQKWATGQFILLECPGSELVCDNGPSPTFRGLMERIRSKAEGKIQDHPFRGLNFVTKAMHQIFINSKSKISVLATISPAASSTEETLTALDALALVAPVHVLERKPQTHSSPSIVSMLEQENVSPKGTAVARDELSMPRQWNRDQLMEWMARKHLLGEQFPYDIDGRQAMRMTKRQLLDTFYGPGDVAKADRLHQILRAENDWVARMRVKARMAQERERMSGIRCL